MPKSKPTVDERVKDIINQIYWSAFDDSGETEEYFLEPLLSLIATERKEAVEEALKEIKECPTCNTLKLSLPTPDGDEICPSCGTQEMIDVEIINPYK